MLVSALTEAHFVVFSSKNTIELWEANEDTFVVKDAFDIPGSTVVSVIELYKQDTHREVDYMSQIEDPMSYIPSIRTKRSTANNPDQKNIEVEAPNHIKINSDQHSNQEMPTRERNVTTMNELNRMAFDRIPSNLDKKAAADSKNDYGTVTFRHVYFFGTNTGGGLVFEILSSYNYDSQAMVMISNKTYKAQVRVDQKLSFSPIKVSYFYYLADGIPLIVTETTTRTGEHLVQGFRLNLEVEWSCKVDMIRLSMNDRCTRYVNKDTMHSSEMIAQRPREDALISSYDYDTLHSCLLFGTTAGVILRFFYQRETVPTEDETQTGKKEMSFSGQPAVDASMPGKLMWCLEVLFSNLRLVPFCQLKSRLKKKATFRWKKKKQR